MNTTPLTDLRALIGPHVPGCPVALMDQQIQLAVEEFYRQSGAYRVTLDPIRQRDGVATYDLDGWPRSTMPFNVAMVKRGTILLRRELDYTVDLSESARTATLTLTSVPHNPTETLNVTVILKPLSTCTDLPALLFEEHREWLAAGALFRLHGIPGKPWSSPEKARDNFALFYRGKAEARIKVETGAGLSRQLRMRPVYRF